MAGSTPADPRAAYDALASVYDGLTAHHDHDRWLALLLDLARTHGLSGARTLDVGCGTGKSFMPLVRRGFHVTGCDISPAMAAVARRRARGHAVQVRVADMRRLPVLCPRADLVTCLDDAVNYMLDGAELQSALAGMRANLRPGGLLLFDVNTVATYQSVFCEGVTWAHAGHSYAAVGERVPVRSGGRFATTLQAWRGDLGSGTLLAASRHVQRHYAGADLRRALHDAGLEPLGLYGSGEDGLPEPGPDEHRHVKTIVVARRPTTRGEGR
jgi:SAM-dependent methyltransferase